MVKTSEKEIKRVFRHQRIRQRIFGDDRRLRLCVHRSHKNFYVQIIDDSKRKVLFGMSTRTKKVCTQIKNGGDIKAAAFLGEIFAEEAKTKGIKKVSFDRGGYLYHGRVKAFAEAARKGGLEF